MYRQHFGLSEKPFRVVPSPRFLFASETHDENRARVLYGIREDRGFVVVSGGIGLGKTTVLLSVLDRLGWDTRVALIFNPVEDFKQLLRMICHEFDIDPEGCDEVEMMRRLNLFLVERLAEGQKCVLIIDEAQNLPIEVLEKIRTLSNLQTEELSLLQIVLVGQPELRDKLDDPRLVQLRQRIGVWHELSPLTREETRSYIWHRLRLSGAPMAEKIIPDDACHRVFDVSEGIPRLINQICDTAMVVAYGRERESVGVHDVEEAARELQLMDTGRSSEATPEKKPRKPRRPLPRAQRIRAVAAVFVVALLLSGAITYDSWLPWLSERLAQPLRLDSPDPEDRGAAEGAEESPTSTAPVETSDTGSAAAEIDWARVERAVERRDAVEGLRASGTPIFSVHLASFRSPEGARSYVEDLLRRERAWAEPLYVDRTAGTPIWYRVLAGGFPRREEARNWMREIRSDGSVEFAKLDRLPRDASPVLLSGVNAEPEESGDEQHS